MKIGENVLFWTGISAGSGLIFDDSDIIVVDGQTRRNQATLIMELMELHGVDPTSMRHLINTHSDFDHIGGNAAFLERVPEIQVVAGALEADKIENPFPAIDPPSFASERMVENLTTCNVAIPVDADMTLTAGDLRIRILCTPGHSPGGICVYHEASQSLFTGDTVLGSGRWGGPMGLPLVRMDLKTMITSLTKLAQLQVEWLLPGHGNIIHDGTPRIRETIRGLQELPSQVLRVLDHKRTLAEISDALLVYPATINAALTMLANEGKIRSTEQERVRSETQWVVT